MESFLAQLAGWTASARADGAVRSRVRERWLGQQAREDARFAGVALDLAERGVGVGVRTTTGTVVHGRIVAVGRDFCALRGDDGTAIFLTLPAIATVRPEAGQLAQDAASDRSAPLDTSLAEVLVALAGERPRIRLVVEGGGDALAGELRAAGADVLTMRLDSDPPATVYVRLASVRELTLPG